MAEGWCVAVGGNAIAPGHDTATVQAQRRAAENALAAVVGLVERRRRVLVTHGNGPQVGAILARAEAAGDAAYALPLDACVAQSQGELGHLLMSVLEQQFHAAGRTHRCVNVVTRVTVDPNDPALQAPVKPIGPWFPEDPQRGFPVVHVEGKGWRRVVPSPEPIAVLELDAIRDILADGTLVVAGGGGGIPVRADDHSAGVECVVDKDHTSALLAIGLGLKRLLFLTDVAVAETGFGGDAPVMIGTITAGEAERLFDAGEFAPGSMGPKVAAAIRFVRAAGAGAEAIITDPADAVSAVEGIAGTRIVRDA
ncbi:MAG: amino acid kinase family protein [Planctomycetota bacterium]|jgi:carbamate kinase